ncbi:type II CAAX prenyl endopeptidase Rce1 family protein [Stenomitos frigidus]|uniref:CPBP family intramembrane metalloprotease n=1 Tax=Stenomitos frigidus ULC18 TaxID=2107698 RepID=A0A2T1ELG6_9CYAN|nr:CPBP family glutamic-type intramembrane protease [Stenomitos frigidus]PSB33592.1 CPBP family intramembrane metalloprotease [Stenomitos frigidus ULC18]
MQSLFRRVILAFSTVPTAKDWLQAVVLLLIFALIYLPIGFTLGFLNIDVQTSWQTIVSVAVGAFFMPALLEECGFRALLLPHSTEAILLSKRWLLSSLSWCLFVGYHLHPFVPPFFRTPAFLSGAGLLGIICTISYLKSGSVWTPIAIHWLIVVAWLLCFGGLEKFQG